MLQICVLLHALRTDGCCSAEYVTDNLTQIGVRTVILIKTALVLFVEIAIGISMNDFATCACEPIGILDSR